MHKDRLDIEYKQFNLIFLKLLYLQPMKAILIPSSSSKDLDFLKELVNKLGYEYIEMDEDEVIDDDLLNSMMNSRKNDFVSSAEIKEALSN